MVSRHPHVFGTTSVSNADEVLRNWEHQKAHEARKAGKDESVVDRVPASLPALAWALGLQKRAARVGFDFKSPLEAAVDARETFDEMGDLLFAVVSLARRMKVNPEDALRVAGQRFRDRFSRTEASLREEGKTFRDLDPEQLALRWEENG
jgi:tetrapyrrole methylase family protein/MazG family protein